jgi:2-hydroxymuconate-semialdehyde hydrolase
LPANRWLRIAPGKSRNASRCHQSAATAIDQSTPHERAKAVRRPRRGDAIAKAWLVEGEEAPVLLILGSGPGVTGYANWRSVIPRRAPNFTIFAPDIVGFGYTDSPPDFIYDLDH